MLDGKDQIMKQHLKPDLLIIDDIGLQALPSLFGEDLFAVITITGKSYRRWTTTGKSDTQNVNQQGFLTTQ